MLQYKPSHELEHPETSQVAQTARQASTRPIEHSIVKRLEKNDSEIQTEPISVKTQSCNTLQVRKKDKAILTELKQFEKNTETQTESISVKARSSNTPQVQKKDVAVQTELKQFQETACNTEH